MKYYLIAGEASGDLHGSNLIKALKKEDKEATFRAWGGDLMQNAGAELAKHYKDLAFMGVWEVIKHLPTILRNFNFCKQDIQAFAPDVMIFIDYSGFNLRIAKWTKQQNLKNFYYISPQIWATREKRVHKIKAHIDRMFVILPFEKTFYQKHNYTVDFVGHPLLDSIADRPLNKEFKISNQLDKKPIIALLPGSRKQEIKAMLPVMLSVVTFFDEYQFVIAAAPALDSSFYENIIGDNQAVKLLVNQTYDLLENSEAALVTSGTATLEAALFSLPQVVCYRASALLYAIVKRIIKVKFISIVNLIMQKKIVEELIQQELNTNQLKEELQLILKGGENRTKLLDNYKLLHQKLGNSGASTQAAFRMYQYLVSPSH